MLLHSWNSGKAEAHVVGFFHDQTTWRAGAGSEALASKEHGGGGEGDSCRAHLLGCLQDANFRGWEEGRETPAFQHPHLSTSWLRIAVPKRCRRRP